MSNTSWLEEYHSLLNLAKQYDKSIVLLSRDNWFIKLLGWVLFLLSFGKFKREVFATEFATTIGNFQFYPKEWSIGYVEETLVHESEHTKQFRKFSFGIHPLVGLVPGVFIYLLFPLPIFFSYGRYWMEKNANIAFWKYAVKNLRWSEQRLYEDAEDSALSISSVDYLWAYPKNWALKEYKAAVEQIIKEHKNV